MAGPLLLRLQRDLDASPGDSRFDLFAALAHDEHALVCAECIDTVEQMQKQRLAGDRVKHLVGVGPHARALPGSKDDDGEAALIIHEREQ
jgi:hypothetical protein